MEYSRLTKGVFAAVVGAILLSVLATQGRDDAFDAYQNDLPALQCPRVLSPPYLILPRTLSSEYSSGDVALKAERSDPCNVVRVFAAATGNDTTDYKVPLSWRLNNPSTAPPISIKT